MTGPNAEAPPDLGSGPRNLERPYARFLCDISGLLSLSLTQLPLAKRFAHASVERFSDICAVHLVEDDGSPALTAIDFARANSGPGAERAFAVALASRLGFIQEAMRTVQPLLFLRSAPGDSFVEESASRLLQMTGMRSLIVAPMSIGSTSFGTLSFLTDGSAPYDTMDVECAVAVARQLSVALENAQLRERERRIKARLRLLADATNPLFSIADQAEMLQQVLDVIVAEFGDWAAAVSLSDDHLHLIATAVSRAEGHFVAQRLHEGHIFDEAAEQMLIESVREQRPLLIRETDKSVPLLAAPLTDDVDAKSWIMAPLLLGRNEYGAIICYSIARRYDEDDLEVLQELCRRASLALEYAESFARERRLVQALQRATLPSNLAEIPGVTVSATYLPAAQEEKVGGDWYDAFPLDENRVLLTIGDVTGHGLQASVIMAKLRHALNIIAKYEDNPSRLLNIAEEIVLQRFPDAIATAFVALLDTRRATLTYANAGHPYPVLRFRDGSIRQLEAGGLPIGLRHLSGNPAPATVSLEGVDLLMFYTDGLTEATRNIVDGERWLNHALTSDAVLLLDNSADFVKDSCLRGPPLDDVAVLALNFVKMDRWSFASDDRAAAQKARAEFLDRLQQKGVPEDDCAAAELIFGELIGNVANHAKGRVEVALEWLGEQAVLHVIDRGPGYRIERLTRADALSEGGRGLWLVQHLGRELQVKRLAGFATHTRVVFAFGISQTAVSTIVQAREA